MEIFMDIGRRDTTTAYFWQPLVGGYSVFDHDSGWGIDAEAWADRLAERIGGYQAGSANPLGKIWLPHDARAKTFAAKRSAVEIFIDKFGHDRVAITPNSKIEHRVNAARVMTAKVQFNATRCEAGLNALRAWSYKYDEAKKTFSSEPEHDWASHDGDGYSYGCLVMAEDTVRSAPEDARFPVTGTAFGFRVAPLEELWKTAPRASERV
jgi:phage terminase large subunit